MVTFITFYGSILAIVMLVVFAYIFHIMFYKRETPSDYTIVRNTYMSQYTRGHAELILLDSIKGTLRTGLVLMPKDLPNLKNYNVKKRKYNIPEEFKKPIIFWVPNNKKHDLPVTTASQYKNIIEIEPFSATDINNDMKGTRLGLMMMDMVTDNNTDNFEKEFISEERDKLLDIVKTNLVGEATAEVLTKLSKMSEDSLEIVSKEKEKKQGFGNASGSTPYS